MTTSTTIRLDPRANRYRMYSTLSVKFRPQPILPHHRAVGRPERIPPVGPSPSLHVDAKGISGIKVSVLIRGQQNSFEQQILHDDSWYDKMYVTAAATVVVVQLVSARWKILGAVRKSTFLCTQ